MKLLLVVARANDIFIYNYAKWLKKSIDCVIDIFEYYSSEILSNASRQDYDNRYYDHVETSKGFQLPLPKGKYLFDSLAMAKSLQRYLDDKQYDIIHSQRVMAPIVLQKDIKKHCRKLVWTFWGGEFEKETILYSSRLFTKNLHAMSKQVDCIINSQTSMSSILKKLPCFRGVSRYASLGSAPLEELYKLMKNENRRTSKIKCGLPTDKLSVLIGYSGKSVHRHIPIIQELHKYPDLKDKIQILAPMTRGATISYVDQVEEELKRIGYSYTLIRGRFLTDGEIARIRNATDVVLQLSEWDGFSRSIMECLCAKSILIYGNWLGYENHLPVLGFKGIEVNSIEKGVEKLAEMVNHIEDFEVMTEQNHENGKNQALWSNCIKDWVSAYKYLLTE